MHLIARKFWTCIAFQLSAGETAHLKLQAIDELGNEVVAAVLALTTNSQNVTVKDSVSVLYPNKTLPLMFLQPKESYEKMKESSLNVKFMLWVIDVWSIFPNGYPIKVELEVCHPGFVYSNSTQTCVCDEHEKAIQR